MKKTIYILCMIMMLLTSLAMPKINQNQKMYTNISSNTYDNNADSIDNIADSINLN